MNDVALFFLAGGAFGVLSIMLNGRQPETLALLAWLYAVALAVCVLIAQATNTEIMAFIAPYVIVLVSASLWSAGLAVYGQQMLAAISPRPVAQTMA